ncbi:MAG: hypothetical protein ISS28_01135 [Candidatus Cloacimonetes bacterium]|nr:hypothetical protein [Actinomycetota bacterium]MBL7085692.1 hypothetical protein [Candidatus Cloacimonadota bacterium]
MKYNKNFTIVSHNCDIDSITHKKIEDYLKAKYGEEKVCHIANFGRFGAKTIVKDISRIYKLDLGLTNELTKVFGSEPTAPIENELKQAKKIFQRLNKKNIIDFIDKNSELFIKSGNTLSTAVRHIGKHASGILISNKNLIDSFLPLIRNGGEIITGIQEGGDEREITKLGYLKLDILGLIAATVINQTIKSVEKKYNIKNLERTLLLSNFNDKKVYKEFAKGNTRDIFQFGSDSMIELLKTIKPTSILAITAVNAMFRPAIIQAGGIDEYIDGMNSINLAKEKADNIHPDLWNITKETYGVPIYQEQIMYILQKIGKFTMAEADKGRKILKLLHKGNQEKSENFNKMIKQFKTKALESKKITEKNLNILLNKLAKYSEYSFNKSHSFSYAVNAYISMWLKINYPKEYFASLLNNSTNEKLSWFMKLVRNANITINDFVIGKSANKFKVDYDTNSIKIGLNLIKGMTKKDIEKLENVQINTVTELVKFVRDIKLGKASIERLCRLNYFKNIYSNSKALEFILIEIKKLTIKKYNKEHIKIIFETFENIEDYTKKERYKWEKKYFNFYLSEHPFTENYQALKERIPVSIDTVWIPKQLNNAENQNYLIFGIINDILKKKTKKGKDYYKLLIEDDERQLYVTIWNSSDIKDLEEGNCIVINTNKSKFGYTKLKNSRILIVNK